jgi:hypothetical protein
VLPSLKGLTAFANPEIIRKSKSPQSIYVLRIYDDNPSSRSRADLIDEEQLISNGRLPPMNLEKVDISALSRVRSAGANRA